MHFARHALVVAPCLCRGQRAELLQICAVDKQYAPESGVCGKGVRAPARVVKAHIEVHGADQAALAREGIKLFRLALVKAERLFAHDVFAVLKQGFDHCIVQVRRRTHMNAVDALVKKERRVVARAWYAVGGGKFLRALARPADDKGNIDSVCAQGVNVCLGDEARAPDGGSLHGKSSRFFL